MPDALYSEFQIRLPHHRATASGWLLLRKGTNGSASGEIVRGLSVTVQKPADVLGAYVYLPTSTAVGGTA